jgi:hypothetical protein
MRVVRQLHGGEFRFSLLSPSHRVGAGAGAAFDLFCDVIGLVW